MSDTHTRLVGLAAITVPGAVYKGLAIAHTSRGGVLYAANFTRGRVDVFDSHFRRIRQPGAFRDPHLPRGYAPFNVANLAGRLYVTPTAGNSQAPRMRRTDPDLGCSTSTPPPAVS